ncbi:hypothetical protein GLYMA_07G062100v4 [Glycine max]|uniref:Glycosyl transferase family 1 domain-containing protein n=1 Tax=Glycine max TaxID=3847 RepID=A0A0R0J486_SOYBN|nr:uncharacterized protein LOC100806723 isoform X2 [Glycine max]KAH1085667.1 hypothetical protein GYH30_017574 [Glycine max]KRH48002.1 hypothetical protein GLYMA_07G062100v4 [Glycine max]|eukprot:XP_006583261.1 uncharacterized protein LOC100806723 isoform X2 [Glycine max]
MGSLESGISLKKGSLFGSQFSRKEKNPFSHRFRSSFSRLLFKKLDYVQWICTVVVFLCLVIVFQMFLPGSVLENSEEGSLEAVRMRSDNLFQYGDIHDVVLDIGEDAVFLPKISEKFSRAGEGRDVDLFNHKVPHFGYRKPQLALVFGELLVDSQQLLMVTVGSALQEIGYEIQVFSLEDGPGHNVWRNLRVPITIIRTCDKRNNTVDWLNYDGIIVSSLEAKSAFSCFLQEPFKSIPLIWIVHENALAYRSRQYTTNGQIELLNDWGRVFNRSTVVVFPNYALPMIYSTFDAGNFYVIPGSPAETLEAEAFMALQKDNLRANMGYGPEDVIIAIVGSRFLYKGMWLGHAIVLRALKPLLEDFLLNKDNSSAQFRIIVHSEELTNNYTVALETMAHSLKYPGGIIEHIAGDLNADSVLGTADVVIYGSFLEEQSFPEILIKAMSFEKPIIAPDVPMIRKYLKDRMEQSHGTWEDVYKSAKRADRSKNDLHERDEGELERTGQPLCIYEPYFGEGSWPFLHKKSLYRGIGLSGKGRRPGRDDVDAPSRLPLLNNGYYRDLLSDYGAFFAIANKIDRLHRNAWIGFQSWRATARKASLSIIAENALLDAIQSKRYGDALYFWVRMDMDSRNPSQTDFWSFCDAVNAGNCKFAFSEAMRGMYGVKGDADSLPPMPVDGDTWSVMQSWAMPTRSFMEFVMFSRMFVDALDAQMYDEHHLTGHCSLSLSKDKHCYSRLLELLVNVWTYHSARRMVFVDPETGLMQEQHKFKSRRGQMWIKWFSYSTLKSMDEDLAELSDSEDPTRHWLWPSTGEVFWQGVFERERSLRHKEKEKRKQKSIEKQNRIRKRHRQQVIGKYIKPPPDEESSNSSIAVTAS